MPPASHARALVVGSLTLDVIAPERDPDRAQPGGVGHYAGRALARLGARVHVVTRARREHHDALLAGLRAEGVAVLALPSRHTTTYRLDYRGDCDRHELLATSDPIRAEDVPPAWRDADLVQLGPLHRRDVLPETAAELRGLVGLDAQGLARERAAAPEPSALDALLPHVDVLQVSESDLPALFGREGAEDFARKRGVRELIVTRGARGAVLITARGRSDVPAAPLPETTQPAHEIGAGDVFLAVYLLQRVRGCGPVDAARGAARACAAHVACGEVPEDFRLEEIA